MPVIPDFTNRAWQQSRSNIQLTISILEGKDRLMPANRGMVSDELARDLVAHVRKFAPEPQPVLAKPSAAAKPTSAPAGKSLAASYTSTGDFEVDFTNLAKQFEDLQRQVRELASVSAGTPPAITPQATAPPDKSSPVSAPAATASPGTAAESGQEKPRVAVAPISDRPFTQDDVVRGQELFLGHRPLAKGGPACIACHAVNRGEAGDGGRLGPELTKAYERAGGRPALSAQLGEPTTRGMQSAYLQHSLESDEVLCLVAYLEEVSKSATADASLLPLKFLLMSLAGSVLALVTASGAWGSRSRGLGWAASSGSAGIALRAAPPDFAPPPL
jgi:mono/diheme cytochrome c family protein